MKSFNEYFVKPSYVYRLLSGSMVKRVEKLSEKIDEVREFSDLYEASLYLENGTLTIRLVIDSLEGWWNDSPGLFELIDLVDSLNAYTSEGLGVNGTIILELTLKERN